MLKDLESDGSVPEDERRRTEKAIQDLTDDNDQEARRDDGAEGRGGPPGLTHGGGQHPSGGDSAPRRRHHGRQRALGRGAGTRENGGAPRGGGCRPQDRPRRPGPGCLLADAVRLLLGELEPSQARGRRADEAPRGVLRERASGRHRERHPHPDDRQPRPPARPRSRDAGRGHRGHPRRTARCA